MSQVKYLVKLFLSHWREFFGALVLYRHQIQNLFGKNWARFCFERTQSGSTIP
ncbi:hypothetical protein CGLAMM_02595 [Acetobacteraceae bacterium EV16G]|uniref:Uncharacterized protein n=1 Tax=Sorlinia euscelidii TaxID=3081148 RepID=A0ABU7U3A0_9PROT